MGACRDSPDGWTTEGDEMTDNSAPLTMFVNIRNRQVVIDFTTAVAYVQLSAEQARAMAQSLLDRAAELEAVSAAPPRPPAD